jgi:hypothetical protein
MTVIAGQAAGPMDVVIKSYRRRAQSLVIQLRMALNARAFLLCRRQRAERQDERELQSDLKSDASVRSVKPARKMRVPQAFRLVPLTTHFP